MSFMIFKVFSQTLINSLPRISVRTGLNFRYITSMELATKDEVDETLVSHKNFTRFRKRQWEQSEKNDEVDAKKECDGVKSERIKRKKMALLLGYCGVNYFGMQRNPGVRTIEEDLLKALYEANYITEEDFKNQQNAQFQRSSRTDKGVSAARQVVSLKLPLEANIEEINKRLPECIKVFGIKRVTNKFNSKGKCNARTYSYTLPTYVFEPSISSVEDRKSYRIPAEKLEDINKVLSYYKGTKSYHNFTEKKYHTDPSASRFMMSFGIEKVFIDSEMEFAVLLVKGQSFMLHQIRKMVGLAIAVVRGHTDMSIMDKVFGKEKVMIPTAPGLGLVLDMVHYDRYDAKFKSSHDSLTWDEVEDTVQKFKHEYIYPIIVKGEVEDNSISEWLEKFADHTYEPADDAQKVKENICKTEEIKESTDDNVDEKEKEIENIEDIDQETNDNGDSVKSNTVNGGI